MVMHNEKTCHQTLASSAVQESFSAHLKSQTPPQAASVPVPSQEKGGGFCGGLAI